MIILLEVQVVVVLIKIINIDFAVVTAIILYVIVVNVDMGTTMGRAAFLYLNLLLLSYFSRLGRTINDGDP